MTMRMCSVVDCDRPHVAAGLCRRHYDRERETGRKRVSTKRIARARAWKRAASAVVAAHRDEFDRIYAQELADAIAETERLHELAAASGVRPHDTVVRLRPGPKPDDETPADRALLDPDRCPACTRLHDRGHRCPSCSADLTTWTDASVATRIATLRRMRCRQCDRNGTQRGEPCAVPGRRWGMHAFELQGASA